MHRQHPDTDPWAAFCVYLASRDRLFPYRSELWLHHDGSIPLRAWFLRHLSKTFLPSANISGHSMRSGGATALAVAGVPASQIQAIGRWSSDSWQVYVRKHPVIIHALMISKQLAFAGADTAS